MTFSREHIIEAPSAKVCESAIASWRSHLPEEEQEEEIGIGSRLTRKIGYMGVNCTIVTEISAFDPNERLGFSLVREASDLPCKLKNATADLRLLPISPEITRAILDIQLGSQGVKAALMTRGLEPFMGGALPWLDEEVRKYLTLEAKSLAS